MVEEFVTYVHGHILLFTVTVLIRLYVDAIVTHLFMCGECVGRRVEFPVDANSGDGRPNFWKCSPGWR